MDQVLLDKAKEEITRSCLAEGHTTGAAERRIRIMLPSAIKFAEMANEFATYSEEEKIRMRSGFFTKLGVSQETATSLAATM